MKQAKMDDIKRQITEDNLANNVQSSGVGSGNTLTRLGNGNDGVPRTTSPRGLPDEASNVALRMPSPSRFRGSVGDTLAQRFARLKAGSAQSVANGENHILSMDLAGEQRPSYHVRGRYSASLAPPPPRRPLGPRNIGSPHSGVPVIPSRVPLDASSLPRAPDPAYSPVCSVPTQLHSNPPRASIENSHAAAVNSVPSRLATSPRTSPGPVDNPYRVRTPNGVHLTKSPTDNSANIPHRPAISASELVDYLRHYNVLLIDVRPREEYDTGHIYTRSIICIEPLALKANVSAEELEERLVVSPEYEQSLFERRNEFDIVVYYDQNTDSVSYLAGSPVGTSAPHLRALYDTLYEFNAYKPLKDARPPALLLGGLNAWIEIMGSQSLATSSTTAVIGSLQTPRPQGKPGRPLGRVPTVVSPNSSLEVRKRRLRGFTPLNSEELKAWMERSEKEEIEPAIEEGEDGSSEDQTSEGESPQSAYYQTYEDFLRRFPEPSAVQESMVMPRRKPVPGQRPISYPSDSVPLAPLRPPPAVPRPSYSGVSDGRHIQPTLERQDSATKTALYTSNSFSMRLRLPHTGLTNFGVTCYMNSTIQCLSATIVLSKFFIDNRFRYYVQKNWKGSQGVMPGLYANLIRALWRNDVEVVMPTSFRNFCGRLNSEWGIDRQQDAKEFFDFVVDCLHEDLNINWQRTPLRPLSFEEEMQRERMPIPKVSKIEWDRYCHREESFISSLFAGQHASRLRCTTCQHTSTTYEAFYSISVEIPPSGSGDIYQCLESYCQEEMLSGDEVWKCPYCKCERIATKQILLTRAPQILVVHFKRFSASKTQSARKVHTPIDFPLHGLNLDRFLVHPKIDASSEASLAKYSSAATTPPFTYDAYAVLRHIGVSMGSGHYISLVRDAQRHCWRRFDDDRHTDFNPRDLRHKDRLQNEQAYIVFYERAPAK